jgi:hypothetical protein
VQKIYFNRDRVYLNNNKAILEITHQIKVNKIQIYKNFNLIKVFLSWIWIKIIRIRIGVINKEGVIWIRINKVKVKYRSRVKTVLILVVSRKNISVNMIQNRLF